MSDLWKSLRFWVRDTWASRGAAQPAPSEISKNARDAMGRGGHGSDRSNIARHIVNDKKD